MELILLAFVIVALTIRGMHLWTLARLEGELVTSATKGRKHPLHRPPAQSGEER